jgi:PAS domain S-box-containing protein
MGDLIRAHEWARTSLGPLAVWPQSLRTALGIMLDSGYAMYIAWGPEFIQFYNDAYRPILGATKHPSALGAGTRETFAEIWDFIGPMFRRVMDLGESTTLVNQLLPLNRYGYSEECYFTFSYSAIRGEGSGVGGVLVTVIETTRNVLDERRLHTLRELAAHSGATREARDARERVERTLRANSADIPFFEIIPAGEMAGRGYDTPAEGETQLIPWPGEAARQALLLPLSRSGAGNLEDILLVGISPHLALDEAYRNFLQLLAMHIAMALDNARAYEAERRRAEELAELDRAKTAFFSNVSHEFRTPLTLLLAPLEDALARPEILPEELKPPLEMAWRNSRRLLKLVNTLLEFSRIEAGRVNAAYTPVRLEQLTADLASSFRSAIESSGLSFRVECEPLPEPVAVDPEMWEKVVLNLLSNAFKFTLEGGISVRLSGSGERVSLEVADTGIGIPDSELPHIFERFHRVEAARGRSFESTGIGLALVSELVRIQGGEIAVQSEEGKGSVFRVSMPFRRGAESLEPIEETKSGLAGTFIAEAERWVASDRVSGNGAASGGRVLFADDNADVREYVARVLGDRFTVRTVPDGEAALAALEEFAPDVVLTDAMMPRGNGFELLSAIRSRPETHDLPVMILSARAGEEARIEGLEAGANDYLIKPFSARELLARVTSQATISRLRKRNEYAERVLRVEARAAERRFRQLLTETPAAIALLRGPEHVFELANEEYLRLVDRGSESELLGRRVIDVFPEIEEQGFIEILNRVYRTAEPFIGRETFVRLERSGQASAEIFLNFVYQPVKDPEGRTEGILFHGVDVTDLVNARTRAEAGERQIRILADTIPQLVWSCSPDGKCDYLSRQWVAYTGIPQTEQLGLRWLDLVMHPEDRQRTYDAWMAAVEERAPYDIEYRLKRFDGSYRWFKTRGSPVRNGAREIERWFGTCTDIEDRKLAERHMLEQQKLESIGLLAGGIAHDFNNLLVGVLGNASLIDETLEEQHPLRPMVRGIVEAGERAAHLTRQMLAYAGKGRIFVERVDVNALVRSTALLVQSSFPKSVRLLLETDAEAPTIEADSGQIQQVIMNLAINGAEAVGDKQAGVVRIATHCLRVDRDYLDRHSFAGEAPREGTYVCIEVQDSGSGIEPGLMTKIFDPFFTTKFTGRGLGLAAVLGIVRSAHGGIEVSSAPGLGTRFRVLLPALEGAAPSPSPDPPHTLERAAGLPVVLVIDDEQIVRHTTRAALRKAGYAVLLAESGEEGLEIFNAPPAKIALVVLDMSMPGMSGKEVLERLRRSDDQVPVLIFSGFSEEQVHSHFEGLRISGFVQKPFTGHQIASAVHSLLAAPIQ